ncbi:hypothetical protein ACFFX0_16175 [Citricoccus parietis]|uniref:Uncharacterized protein n=1 Tax=Citricoccus parietis TaxID=592307 RepID=A0ABV5G149_9MICC
MIVRQGEPVGTEHHAGAGPLAEVGGGVDLQDAVRVGDLDAGVHLGAGGTPLAGRSGTTGPRVVALGPAEGVAAVRPVGDLRAAPRVALRTDVRAVIGAVHRVVIRRDGGAVVDVVQGLGQRGRVGDGLGGGAGGRVRYAGGHR